VEFRITTAGAVLSAALGNGDTQNRGGAPGSRARLLRFSCRIYSVAFGFGYLIPFAHPFGPHFVPSVSPSLWFSWRRTRPFAILFGLSFHLGIALMMKAVWVFSLQMAAFYTLFLPEGVAAELLRRVRQAMSLLSGQESEGMAR